MSNCDSVTQTKILIVNDNTKLANAICQVLKQHGYKNVEVLSEYGGTIPNFFQRKMCHRNNDFQPNVRYNSLLKRKRGSK